MEYIENITSVLVLGGILVLATSLVVGLRAVKDIPAYLRKKWNFLLTAPAAFIVCYVLFLYFHALGTLHDTDAVTGITFLAGAGFVLFVVVLLKASVSLIREKEQTLALSEERYRAIIANSPVGIVVTDPEGQCISTNRAMADIVGATQEQLMKQNYHDIESWKESGLYDKVMSAIKNNRTEHLDTELISSFGKKIYLSAHFTPLHTGEMLVMMDDISDLMITQKNLSNALQDKDILLKEVHHRTKNNLSLIQSLLSIQAHDVHDERSKEHLTEAKGRVKSMGIIYEMLNRTDDLKRLGSRIYIHKLVDMLFQTHRIGSQDIELQYDIEDIDLDVNTMIPLGLIINELVTNALNYAFPDGREGVLGISLKELGNKSYELVIRDTGVGLPEGFDLGSVPSLGLQIVSSLVNKINGTIEVVGVTGTAWKIRFADSLDS